MSFGATFYSCATQPLQAWASRLEQQDIAGALNAIHYQQLLNALDVGIGAAASDAGVRRGVVHSLLPTAQVRAAAEASTPFQQRALEVLNQHQGGVAGFLTGAVGGFVDGYLGIGEIGVGDFLSSLAGKFVQDSRLKGPITELTAALQAYDRSLLHCATILDAELRSGSAPTGARRHPIHPILWALLGVMVIGMGAAAALHWARAATIEATGPSVVDSMKTESTPPSTEPTAQPATVWSASPTRPVARPNAPVSGVTSALRRTTSLPGPTRNSRIDCLHACIASCHDDANCERTCAAGCPPK